MEELFLNFSHATGIYAFMHTSWGWPVIESIHFIGLSLLIGTVGIFDLRMLGFARAIPLSALHKLVPLGVTGFAMNVCSGVMFVTSVPDQYLYNPAFRIKMLFIFLAGVNMVLFYKVAGRAMAGADGLMHENSKAKMFTCISLLCWMVVIVCGRLITFYRPPGYFWCFFCN